MIDNSVVGVIFTGEIVNPFAYAWATAESIYGTPTGFATVPGSTTANYWDTRPATNASTYTSDYATPPTNGDHIGLIGAGSLTQTITFSEPVRDIVMAVYSLGNSGNTASWDFSQDFSILSDNLGASRHDSTGSGLTKSTIGGINRLSGNEGSGTIQFLGTFDTLSWTVSAPESWASWNVGVSSASAPEPSPVPEPGQVAASILLLAGLGGYVWMKRRKTAKPAASAA